MSSIQRLEEYDEKALIYMRNSCQLEEQMSRFAFKIFHFLKINKTMRLNVFNKKKSSHRKGEMHFRFYFASLILFFALNLINSKHFNYHVLILTDIMEWGFLVNC